MADIQVGGRANGLPPARVRRAVEAVFAGERRRVPLSISFIGRQTMRALNREHKGRDCATDVLAFAFPQPDGAILGDVYICPSVARQEAERRGLTATQELTRLVIHGTLHVLGYDHPEHGGRERSPMWRRQERYVRRFE